MQFLQDMKPIDEQEVKDREIELPLKKLHKGIRKLLLFDLDETLAHCVRDKDEVQKADVRLAITT